jgi:hypothetical protein
VAIASTPTKLPLSTFAKNLGMHPLHFEQVRLETNPHCSEIMVQYSWQNSDHVSREEIAIAISQAEEKIENQLGYRLGPSWEVDEWKGVVGPKQPEFFHLRQDTFMNGRSASQQAEWGYFISGGVEAKSFIFKPDITWTDEDGDGYFETGTVTFTTVVTDINEIEAYYPGKDGDATFQIRPITVNILAGVATVTFRRELCVKLSFLEAIDEPQGVDGLDDGNFLTAVDIYRHYNDPSQQVTFLWEPLTFGCGCGTGGCPRCAYNAATGCLMSRGDPRQSILGYSVADWNVDDQAFSAAVWPMTRQPDITRLYYRSGWRNKSQRFANSRMDPYWERVVTYMAAAMLDRPPCDCAADVWYRYRRDLTLVDGSTENDANPIFRQPTGTLDNPFGTKAGEVMAWREVRDKIIGHAALIY